MTVTAVSGTSSPRTFTVTRSVDGVVKTRSTGAEVHVLNPFRLGRTRASEPAFMIDIVRLVPVAPWLGELIDSRAFVPITMGAVFARAAAHPAYRAYEESVISDQ
jgi:hypothetical protein